MMETTEKEKKIVITRAPRIRKSNYADLPAESYYMRQLATFGPDRVFRYELGMKDVPSRRVDVQFVLPYDLGLGHASTGNMVVPFDSFDQMCQWVSNGRKLEDLGGDGRDEWEQLTTLGLGDYFTDNGNVYMIQNFGLGERSTATVECWHIEKSTCVEFNDQRMVWPIDLERGDTITITCK